MQDLSSLGLDAGAVLERLPEGLLLVDDSGLLVRSNQRMRDWLGGAQAARAGTGIDSVVGANAEEVGPGRWRLHLNRGERRWLECRAVGLRAADGRSYTLYCFTDISAFERRAATRAATATGRDPVRVDPETGLLNRRALLQELGGQVSRSRRYGNALSVLRLRHADADAEELLTARRRVAHSLREMLRWVDIVGVLDAREVLVVLPETGLEAGLRVTMKLAQALGEVEADRAARWRLGAAEWRAGDDPSALIERARVAERTVAEMRGG